MLMPAYCSAYSRQEEAKKPHAFVKLSDGGAKARLAASKARNTAQRDALYHSAALHVVCAGFMLTF